MPNVFLPYLSIMFICLLVKILKLNQQASIKKTLVSQTTSFYNCQFRDFALILLLILD